MAFPMTLKLSRKQGATVWLHIPHSVPLEWGQAVFFYYAKTQNPFFQACDHFLSACLQNGSFVMALLQSGLISLHFLESEEKAKHISGFLPLI